MTELVRCPACGASVSMADLASGSIDEGTSQDREQTASDHDQTWSDHDQTASDRDQRSADEDQEASDDVLTMGSDPVTHQRTTLARQRSSGDRIAVSRLRDDTAAARFQSAGDRDRDAALRDRGAAGRDRLARLHDLDGDADASMERVLLRAERDRARAAADRAKAADDRVRAAADRSFAARQREEAHRARAEARDSLEQAMTDELTGVRTRRFGVAEVAREIERARRTGDRLILAFLDVDSLEEVNDRQGHPAGDALLRLVAETVRANVRSYDVIVRYDGDEFLCAMPNLTRAAATERMETITAVLAAANPGHSTTFGLAEHEPDEGLQELISRADEELLATRRAREGDSLDRKDLRDQRDSRL